MIVLQISSVCCSREFLCCQLNLTPGHVVLMWRFKPKLKLLRFIGLVLIICIASVLRLLIYFLFVGSSSFFSGLWVKDRSTMRSAGPLQPWWLTRCENCLFKKKTWFQTWKRVLFNLNKTLICFSHIAHEICKCVLARRTHFTNALEAF